MLRDYDKKHPFSSSIIYCHFISKNKQTIKINQSSQKPKILFNFSFLIKSTEIIIFMIQTSHHSPAKTESKETKITIQMMIIQTLLNIIINFHHQSTNKNSPLISLTHTQNSNLERLDRPTYVISSSRLKLCSSIKVNIENSDINSLIRIISKFTSSTEKINIKFYFQSNKNSPLIPSNKKLEKKQSWWHLYSFSKYKIQSGVSWRVFSYAIIRHIFFHTWHFFKKNLSKSWNSHSNLSKIKNQTFLLLVIFFINNFWLGKISKFHKKSKFFKDSPHELCKL